jgi:hypothetical protein
LEKVAAEPLIGLRRGDYPEHYPGLESIFAPIGVKPRIAMECDAISSLLIEVEAGHGIALHHTKHQKSYANAFCRNLCVQTTSF